MLFKRLAAACAAAALGLLCAGAALAQTDAGPDQRDFAVGLQAGTTGIGVNAKARLGSR